MNSLSCLLCVFALLFVGVCNAETKTKFHENGQKNTKINYKDGKLQGPFTAWNENGQKVSEVNYKDDEPHGLETCWTADGTVKTQIMWQDGKKVE